MQRIDQLCLDVVGRIASASSERGQIGKKPGGLTTGIREYMIK